MIYLFDYEDNPLLSQAGGKGKALIETYKAGFPIPEGMVLTVDYLKPWLEEIKASSEWNALMKDMTIENCNAVKSKAELLKFTSPMAGELKDQLNVLGNGHVFAVRSSSPEEDLEDTSFAGMYETYLGVHKSRLESFIVKAFSSCFDYRVMAYKTQHGMDLDRTSIAIVIQKQIASDVSGVGFSLNPLNNCYDEVSINASFGLGEAIVSGIVTPDTYVVDSVKGEIIEKKIKEKEVGVWLKEDGSTEEKRNEEPTRQALSDEQILELTNLIKKVEAYYKKPIDTEWSYENEKLYLFQARPITAYIPLFPELVTKPGEEKYIYLDVMGLTQGFTDPMSVLGLELWTQMLEAIKGAIMSCSLDGTSPALHGRQYMNLSYMRKAFGGKIVNKVIKSYDGNVRKIFDDVDMMEYSAKKVPDRLKNSKRELLKMGLQMAPGTVRAVFSDYRKVIKEYLIVTDNITDHAKSLDSKENFSTIVSEMMDDLHTIMSSAGFMYVGMLALNSIKKMFKGHDIEALVTALAMDLEGNPTSDMGHFMFKLASYDEFKKTVSKEDFLEKVNTHAYSSEFMKAYDEFMEKYGFRGFMEVDVATKRAYEEPGLLFDGLKNINTEESQITKVKQKREEAYEKLLAVAQKGGFDKKFIKQAEKYQAVLGYREHPKYIIVYIYAMLHNICLEIGKEFVQQGRLDDKQQIFDLHVDEISKAKKDSSLNLMTMRENNIEPYKVVAHVKDWPLVIDSRGKIFKPKIEIKEGDIIGDPIAPGKVRGRVKVLNSPYEKPLNTGEILVTKATEPSWTPIFINAAGVVMEIGGPLQHGGIIAREYGIPCVSGLMGIMEILKDGDLIEVDGNNGIIHIIEEGDSDVM